MTENLGQSFRQARRELWFQLTTWAVFAAWVVGYGSLTAFRAESPDVETVIGIPAWVFWGIALPWVMALVVTIYFAGWFMRDTELVDDTHLHDGAAGGAPMALGGANNDTESR